MRLSLKRNAAVVLGNLASAEDVPPLASALRHDEPLVWLHAAWALGRSGSPPALEALRARMTDESDASVVAELRGVNEARSSATLGDRALR